MSYTQTPNYLLYKPTVNADNDQWGTHLNANADTIDTQLKTIANTAGVVSFNTRTGTVSLLNADVTTVLPPSSTTPVMDGAGTVGSGTTWARADHQHPSDTSRAPLASPVFTGDARAVTPAVGDNDTSIATTAFVQTAVAPAQNNVGRNLLHNPLANVAQRGAGGFTTNGYTLDRWTLALLVAGQTAAVQQYAMNDGNRAQIGDEAAKFMLLNTFTGSATTGAYLFLQQLIEDVFRLSGKTVTVSFWAQAGSGTLGLGVCLTQYFGTGGSPSAAVSLTGQKVTVTTTWQRYSLTFALPSASGKTLGTNGNSMTGLELWYSSDTATYGTRNANLGAQSGSIALWGVQLEIGSVATPLEKPDPQQDLAKCQRFYQYYPNFGVQGYVWSPGAQTYSAYTIPQMRAGPTATPIGTAYGNASALTFQTTAANYLNANITGTAAGWAYATFGLQLSADL